MANFRVGICQAQMQRPRDAAYLVVSHSVRRSRWIQKKSPIDSFMTNFHLGCSIRTQERHRSRLPLTNYDPRGTFGENEKIISPIAYFMANLGGKSAIHNPQPGHCRMLICEVQARLHAAGHAADDFLPIG